jgi:hypothetical protein
MSNRGLAVDTKKPSILKVEGGGYVEFLEFENDIWIQDVFAEKRGSGNRLAREFLRYARTVNKNVYGGAIPVEHHTTMDEKRLKRWYYLLGGRPIKMKHYPSAMELRIRK